MYVVVGIFRLGNLEFALDWRQHHIRLIDKQVARWKHLERITLLLRQYPSLGFMSDAKVRDMRAFVQRNMGSWNRCFYDYYCNNRTRETSIAHT